MGFSAPDVVAAASLASFLIAIGTREMTSFYVLIQAIAPHAAPAVKINQQRSKMRVPTPKLPLTIHHRAQAVARQVPLLALLLSTAQIV